MYDCAKWDWCHIHPSIFILFMIAFYTLTLTISSVTTEYPPTFLSIIFCGKCCNCHVCYTKLPNHWNSKFLHLLSLSGNLSFYKLSDRIIYRYSVLRHFTANESQMGFITLFKQTLYNTQHNQIFLKSYLYIIFKLIMQIRLWWEFHHCLLSVAVICMMLVFLW